MNGLLGFRIRQRRFPGHPGHGEAPVYGTLPPKIRRGPSRKTTRHVFWSALTKNDDENMTEKKFARTTDDGKGDKKDDDKSEDASIGKSMA